MYMCASLYRISFSENLLPVVSRKRVPISFESANDAGETGNRDGVKSPRYAVTRAIYRRIIYSPIGTTAARPRPTYRITIGYFFSLYMKILMAAIYLELPRFPPRRKKDKNRTRMSSSAQAARISNIRLVVYSISGNKWAL
jgi:hypothetical protein